MSNIDQESLVFALPNPDNPDAKVIMCQMSAAMIMNWMFVVHPHVEKYRKVQNYYFEAAIRKGVDTEDLDAIYNLSNELGMKDDVQILMMEVIADLRKTMGDEDFLELYQMETTEEDDAFLASQAWVGLNDDGTSHNAKLVDEVPHYDGNDPITDVSDSAEQLD
jgi:hypothetical protein